MSATRMEVADHTLAGSKKLARKGKQTHAEEARREQYGKDGEREGERWILCFKIKQ